MEWNMTMNEEEDVSMNVIYQTVMKVSNLRPDTKPLTVPIVQVNHVLNASKDQTAFPTSVLNVKETLMLTFQDVLKPAHHNSMTTVTSVLDVEQTAKNVLIMKSAHFVNLGSEQIIWQANVMKFVHRDILMNSTNVFLVLIIVWNVEWKKETLCAQRVIKDTS